ncbi:MAG TPA: hypothetical protein VFZ68_13355 [Acidimicrobiales bacterium]
MAEDTHQPAGELTDLLGQMRSRVDAAGAEIDALTAEIVERTRTVEELEALVDALLDVAGAALVVVGIDRRVKAVSRRAVKLLDGTAPVGKPASTVLPENVARKVAACLDDAAQGAGWDGDGAMVQRLPSGDALVILDEQ